VTFKQLLEGRNVEGEIYRCDIKLFFGDLSRKKVDEIHKSLMENPMETQVIGTGLMDKNGKEICKGYHIKIDYQSDSYMCTDTWEVCYSTKRACFELRHPKANWTPWLWSEIRGDRGENLAEIVKEYTG